MNLTKIAQDFEFYFDKTEQIAANLAEKGKLFISEKLFYVNDEMNETPLINYGIFGASECFTNGKIPNVAKNPTILFLSFPIDGDGIKNYDELSSKINAKKTLTIREKSNLSQESSMKKTIKTIKVGDWRELLFRMHVIAGIVIIDVIICSGSIEIIDNTTQGKKVFERSMVSMPKL